MLRDGRRMCLLLGDTDYQSEWFLITHSALLDSVVLVRLIVLEM
jgi:hypothetical protein